MKARLDHFVVLAAASLLVSSALTTAAEAQSVFATRGLGFPMQAHDARSRGLGGVALGLPGADISWTNPATSAGLAAPGFLISYQYDDFSTDGAGGDFAGSTARFPLLLAAFPAGERVAFQVGFGSYLDQNWSIQEADTLVLGTDTLEIIDLSSSTGGVTRLRFGAAYAPTPTLSVGLGLDVYTGSVERVQGRIFPGEPRPACCTVGWDYSGQGVTAGVHWSPTADSGVGASLTYGGKLDAAPSNTLVSTSEWAIPLSVQGGASGRVGATVLVAVGGSWTGWSDLDDRLAAEGGAQNSWTANAGVEWDGLSIRERPLPLRVGARTGALPFRWDSTQGVEWGTERAVTFGGGLDLAGGAARTDFSVELGDRGGEAAAIEESFWRVGMTVRVLGR